VKSAADRRGVSAPGLTRRAVVDYTLQRRARLADLFAGRASFDDVCDAHPYLLRAAKFHGQTGAISCPVCRKEALSEVHYVYGDALKTTAGQAKTTAELGELEQRLAEFTVYVVEVCVGCGWNHLTTSFVMGRGAARPARRRTAPE
jgi:hypothetical protein